MLSLILGHIWCPGWVTSKTEQANTACFVVEPLFV